MYLCMYVFTMYILCMYVGVSDGQEWSRLGSIKAPSCEPRVRVG